VNFRPSLLTAAFLQHASAFERPRQTIDTCFSPRGYCDQVLISWIHVSRTSLDAAIYGLTDKAIAEAL